MFGPVSPARENTIPIPFRILTVCTGNIARSPLAAHLLSVGIAAQAGGADPGQVAVSSAGTSALVGEAPVAPIASLAERLTGSAPGSVARQLSEPIVRQSSLILTATRQHRRQVVSLVPRASVRTFTLLEFARLVGHLRSTGNAPTGRATAEEWLDLASAAAAHRGFVPPVPEAQDDVEDPYGRSSATYERSARAIADAVATVMGRVA